MNWRVRRIVDNLWGPSGTVLFHILIVLLMLKFVQSARRAEETQVEVVVKEIESVEKLDDIQEDLDQLEDIPTVVDAVAPPKVSVDQEPPQVDALSSGTTAGPDMSEFDIMETVSPLRFKGLYMSRSAAGRREALGKYSGGLGEQTEYSVLKSLEWLKKHQYPDGSWGPNYRCAMTGLALLAFLAHGETTGSEDYGDAVRKGLRFLLKNQKNGLFSAGGGPGNHTQNAVYEHAIASYAVAEAYGMTSIPFLKIAMEDAVQVMIDGQHEGNGWDYGYRKGPDANLDVSLGGWHLQALKAAYGSGAENRGLKAAIDSGVRGFKGLADQNATGLFRYSTRQQKNPDLAMTSVAVLCMQLTGHALDAEARAGIKTLGDMGFRWGRGEQPNQDLRGTGEWPLYAWYYVTQARFHQGGKTWVTWNKPFATSLCAMQNPDGSWGPAPQSAEASYGPVYCTTLGALMLEVYYRFLPTYQPIQIEETKPAADQLKDEEEEIVVKFG
jgi:hypothetical protein